MSTVRWTCGQSSSPRLPLHSEREPTAADARWIPGRREELWRPADAEEEGVPEAGADESLCGCTCSESLCLSWSCSELAVSRGPQS